MHSDVVSESSFRTLFPKWRPRQRDANTLLPPAAVNWRSAQPCIAGLQRIHPLIDRHTRPLNVAVRAAAMVVSRDVLNPVLTEQRLHALSVLRAALSERELPGSVLQDLR